MYKCPLAFQVEVTQMISFKEGVHNKNMLGLTLSSPNGASQEPSEENVIFLLGPKLNILFCLLESTTHKARTEIFSNFSPLFINKYYSVNSQHFEF